MGERPEQFPVANEAESSGGHGGLEHHLGFMVQSSL